MAGERERVQAHNFYGDLADLDAATLEDVRRIAHDYLTPDKMTLVIVGDIKTVKEQVAPWSGR